MKKFAIWIFFLLLFLGFSSVNAETLIREEVQNGKVKLSVHTDQGYMDTIDLLVEVSGNVSITDFTFADALSSLAIKDYKINDEKKAIQIILNAKGSQNILNGEKVIDLGILNVTASKTQNYKVLLKKFEFVNLNHETMNSNHLYVSGTDEFTYLVQTSEPTPSNPTNPSEKDPTPDGADDDPRNPNEPDAPDSPSEPDTPSNPSESENNRNPDSSDSNENSQPGNSSNPNGNGNNQGSFGFQPSSGSNVESTDKTEDSDSTVDEPETEEKNEESKEEEKEKEENSKKEENNKDPEIEETTKEDRKTNDIIFYTLGVVIVAILLLAILITLILRKKQNF